ncbi:MAG: phosphoglycerol geranylgeranyltransferase [bacterium]|nr:phosphoglycerol geranylgeranyltransferase [bacterium]
MAVIELLNSKHKSKKKGYFVLVDPDKKTVDIEKIVKNVNRSFVDALLVGGSKCDKRGFNTFIKKLGSMTETPLVIFPGSHDQISRSADAILLLSLLNSLSLKHVIGEHINGAKKIVKSGIEVIPTAYIVMDRSGKTSVSQAAQIMKLVNNRDVDRYLYASAMMSYKVVYLEAGSGSEKTIPESVIKRAGDIIDKPIIVGGGIRDVKTAKRILSAGADYIVTGNAIENDPDLILDFGALVKGF